jgi:hypothetical protein
VVTDELERRLRKDLPAASLPQAPASLRARIEVVVATEQVSQRGTMSRPNTAPRISRNRVVLGIAAILLLGGTACPSSRHGHRASRARSMG